MGPLDDVVRKGLNLDSIVQIIVKWDKGLSKIEAKYDKRPLWMLLCVCTWLIVLTNDGAINIHSISIFGIKRGRPERLLPWICEGMKFFYENVTLS